MRQEPSAVDEPEGEPEAEPAAELEPEDESRAEPEPEIQGDPEPEPEGDAQTELEPEVQGESEPEPDDEPEVPAEPVLEVLAEPEDEVPVEPVLEVPAEPEDEVPEQWDVELSDAVLSADDADDWDLVSVEHRGPGWHSYRRRFATDYPEAGLVSARNDTPPSKLAWAVFYVAAFGLAISLGVLRGLFMTWSGR